MHSDRDPKEDAFERDKTEIFISEHYIFHYCAGSVAEKDILLIAETQEKCFSKICSTLKTDYTEIINYYLTDSPLEIGRVIWNEDAPCNGCALCGRNKVYAAYNDNIKCVGSHEDTHLISFLMNFPESDFVVEGLAMYMDGLWWGVSNEIWAAYYKMKHADLSVKDLFDNDIFADYSCTVTYPIAGAFSKFLIDTFGMERYIELYKYAGEEYETIMQSIFHASFEDIVEQFCSEMSRIPFDASALEEMLRSEGF